MINFSKINKRPVPNKDVLGENLSKKIRMSCTTIWQTRVRTKKTSFIFRRWFWRKWVQFNWYWKENTGWSFSIETWKRRTYEDLQWGCNRWRGSLWAHGFESLLHCNQSNAHWWTSSTNTRTYYSTARKNYSVSQKEWDNSSFMLFFCKPAGTTYTIWVKINSWSLIRNYTFFTVEYFFWKFVIFFDIKFFFFFCFL